MDECKNEYKKIDLSLPKYKEYFESFKEQDARTLTKDEENYRRGFCQGFEASRRNPKITVTEVYLWKDNKDLTGPPGSYFSGVLNPMIQTVQQSEEFNMNLEKVN